MNKQKIALILTNNLGGLYFFRREIVEKLVETGYKTYISAPEDIWYARYFKEMGCLLFRTPFERRGMNPFADLRLLIKYVKILHRIKPSVSLTYTIKPNVYGGLACRICDVPQIATITGLGVALENGGWLKWISLILYRVGVRKAKYIFFQNQSNKDFFVRYRLSTSKLVLVPGSGVNLKYHSLQEMPLQDNSIKFAFIGRVIKEKGINEYLLAAKDIKKTHKDVEFHVIGYCGKVYEKILEQYVERRVVFYHGEQYDVRPFIGNVHCLVLPSFYPEGMSNVLLESCAAGRPIITTDRPGCGEIIDNGINGFVVKPNDKSDLIKAIERFMELPFETKVEMGLAGRRKVEKLFDREIVLQQYQNAVNDIEYNN